MVLEVGSEDWNANRNVDSEYYVHDVSNENKDSIGNWTRDY